MSGHYIKHSVLIAVALIVVATIAVRLYLFRPSIKQDLIVSTTTSLYDTGLLDQLKKDFEQRYPQYIVNFIPQGTGQAIKTAQRGDADLILVHDPDSELKFLQEGYGVNRKIFAYNFYIIVGPQDDPAGVKGLQPLDALRKIAEEAAKGNALWVSRGDNSGTHLKEKSLWKAAGLNLSELKAQRAAGTGQNWYLESGTGMTTTLQLANQKQAYTLSDIATFQTNTRRGSLQLTKIVEEGREMLNVYSAIICNPQRLPKTDFEAAIVFTEYLTTEGQSIIKTFGVTELGEALFNSWSEAQSNQTITRWVEGYAFFEGSECPERYRYQADNLYK
ncbi:MAG: substrate-binding domain-containing protein [Candidatus Bathyarchaeia archaeon]